MCFHFLTLVHVTLSSSIANLQMLAGVVVAGLVIVDLTVVHGGGSIGVVANVEDDDEGAM